MNIRIKGRVVYFILLAFFLVFLGILLFEPIETIYDIQALTEQVSCETVDKSTSRLNLRNAKLYTLFDQYDTNFNGSIEIASDVEINFERIGGGAAIIRLRGEEGKVVSKTYSEGDDEYQEHETFLEIVLDSLNENYQKGKSQMFPIEGKITLGKSVDIETFEESKAILLNGEISMTGITNLLNERFDAGEKKLNISDRLEFDEIKEKSYGIVSFSDPVGMRVSYRLESKNARIIKPGSKGLNRGINVRAKPIDRLLNSTFFQFLSMFFGGLVILISISTFIFDLDGYFKKKTKKK